MAGKYLAPRKNTPGCRPKGGDPIRDKRRKIITIALAVLFFLLALGLTVYPIFSSRYNEVHQSQIHTEYQDAVQALPDTAIPEAMAKAQAYNEELWSSIVQYGSYSKDSVTSAVEEYAQLLDLTGTGTMGYVHIPRLGVSLPIYHGTEEETLDRGGNVVIPAFAVGRTQELLYYFRQIKSQHLIHGHDNFEVYVDSPLAVEATHVFKENQAECYDEETRELVEEGINPIAFPGLKLSVTSDESININFDAKPKVIISASGMCDAGRIRHHLKHNLWRRECTVIFAGYQAVGTIGRALVDGAKEVKLFGESIDVEAHIEVLHDISGHADQNGLLTWALAFEKKPQQFFVVHGNDDVCDRFAELITEKTGVPAKAPFSGSEFDLIKGVWVRETAGIPIQAKSAPAKKASGVFARLLAAGERLMGVIRRNEGGANKDLAKFADQINALCDKWDR